MQHVEDKRELADRGVAPVIVEAWFPRSPESCWHVLELRGVEAISRPFEFELELFSDDPSADLDELLGADLELLLDRNGRIRIVYGVLASVELLTTTRLTVRVRLVPAFALLDQVVDTRFFTGQTVPQILQEVLTPALADYGRSIDCESFLDSEYNARDYCVQFRESILAFCSRIMEEEGIAYVFAPDEEQQRETLVLIDNNEGFQSVELLVPGAVPLMLDRPQEHDRESIQTFNWRSVQTPNRIVARGYNMKSPRSLDEGQAERVDTRRHVVRSLHLDGEVRQIIDDPVDDPDARTFTGCALAQRGPMAARELERHTLESARGCGRSTVVGFAAGHVFELDDHPVHALAARKYLLVEVEHEASSKDWGDRGHAYTNHFECVPLEHPFRPAHRTPRPAVYGVQTGVVVGRVADEVYTDQFGRVRVRFHRDRVDADENASCWIPVAQSWAGPGYGMVVLPRVGMEVVVSFVDGNPDCPIVTGCVYNGANMPPYGLPGELTKTSFKTCSSPGGDGFNELRLEDACGSEQIFVHAQRRMDLRVRGSLYETVAGSREERVGSEHEGERSGDHNTLVRGDVNHHTEETRYTKIDKQQHTSVGEDVIEDFQRRHVVVVGEISQLSAPRIVVEASEYVSHKADELELAGSSTISVKGGAKVVVESNNAIELKVGGSFVSITPEGVDIQGLKVRLNSGGGTGLRATEGIPALAVDLLEPLDAFAADDGRCGPVHGSGRGGGSTRTRKRRVLEPHHAPPMKPPPPKRPGSPAVLPDGTVIRRFLRIRWVDSVAYCSDRATLRLVTQHYRSGDTEALTLTNAADGAPVRATILRPGEGVHERSVEIRDILPRQTMAGPENERALHASAGGLTTLAPIRLQFLSTVARTWYGKGRARFNLSIENGEVIVGGTIYYVRGWIHEIIALGDTVPEGTGGLIGFRRYGTKYWRYCKYHDRVNERVYWDGSKWSDLPGKWRETDRNVCSMGVWTEGESVKTQFGTLAWPDPLQDWNDFFKKYDSTVIRNQLVPPVERIWSGRFDIKRQQCRSLEAACCRYRVRCQLRLELTDTLRDDGIVIHLNDGRSNATVWSMWPEFEDEQSTWAHEFGHHLGNPDEYEGAPTVDPAVNSDGATAGIDDESIMGKGTVVKKRHYQTLCDAVGELVSRRTGRDFTYIPVEVLQP